MLHPDEASKQLEKLQTDESKTIQILRLIDDIVPVPIVKTVIEPSPTTTPTVSLENIMGMTIETYKRKLQTA